LARGEKIALDDLPDTIAAPEPAVALDASGDPLSLEANERRAVQRALAESATLEEAASRLGINVTTLWRKRKRWKLD
jgi:NtrC-family two-component system response regulator AlgB